MYMYVCKDACLCMCTCMCDMCTICTYIMQPSIVHSTVITPSSAHLGQGACGSTSAGRGRCVCPAPASSTSYRRGFHTAPTPSSSSPSSSPPSHPHPHPPHHYCCWCLNCWTVSGHSETGSVCDHCREGGRDT